MLQAYGSPLYLLNIVHTCHLLITACATLGLNSHKQYHKYHKYNDFDDRLCDFGPFQAQAVI